jgi:DNA polymerase-3 subunit beta
LKRWLKGISTIKNAIEIVKSFEQVEDDITITLQKNQISIKSTTIYLTSRVVDGNFPDYKQIIPKNKTTEINVLKQDIASSLKISNVFSDKFNQISFKINPKQKVFEIRSENSDIGENTTIINASLSGEATEVNFNYKYIMDCFNSISSDSLIFELNGSNKAMIIKPTNDASFMYLVMPMNR